MQKWLWNFLFKTVTAPSPYVNITELILTKMHCLMIERTKCSFCYKHHRCSSSTWLIDIWSNFFNSALYQHFKKIEAIILGNYSCSTYCWLHMYKEWLSIIQVISIVQAGHHQSKTAHDHGMEQPLSVTLDAHLC